ncbi:hypothetical protein HRW18_04995 [Streptomyces lunaelactis]|uniref:hypothetical protein n=1 Tax=Streptomyces lunaelactis TaxID=1535768 RepID=UPI001584AB01|nr:hypothetical protein [Streptomyces lunaelactis]NUK07380.1 hypothetical protein [Streptomyces lunaelactis]NUL09405.1 hypothetical protein [Streptomyces lunaelactis]NUL22211.1 hypothetical protein [Streptomyces lunaelactis]
MQNLTPNEQRHVASLEQIRTSPLLEAECGTTDELAEPVEDLLPLYEHNPDWEDVEFNESLLSCSLRFSDLGARWATSGNLPEIYGEFRLLHFYDVFDQTEGPSGGEETTNFQQEFLSQLRIFDHTPRSGAGMVTYIRMKPHVTPLEIWYQDIADIGSDPYPANFIRMNITYCEYLEALLLTKGTYGWQYLYTDISLRGREFHSKVRYLKNMLDVFPGVFPQYDYTSLTARLEERL